MNEIQLIEEEQAWLLILKSGAQLAPQGAAATEVEAIAKARQLQVTCSPCRILILRHGAAELVEVSEEAQPS